MGNVQHRWGGKDMGRRRIVWPILGFHGVNWVIVYNTRTANTITGRYEGFCKGKLHWGFML